jgi:agmatine deiminase
MYRLFFLIAILLISILSCIIARRSQEQEYPAEWEPHEAIWMGFRSNEYEFDSVTIPMLRALTSNVDVRLVVEADSLIPDGIGFLGDMGIDTSRVSVFIQSPTDFWFRDPGPIFLRRRDGSLAVADFLYSNYSNDEPESFSAKAIAHEKIDEDVALRLGLPTIESNVVMEGGSIEVNGKGTLIVSELTRRRNPHLTRAEIEDDLKRTLGQAHVIWLGEGLAEDPQDLKRIVDNYYGYGTGGHTDEFVRFADAQTVLLAWVNEEDRHTHPINEINYERMSRNFEILRRSTDQDGNSLRIIRVPLPEVYWEELTISEENASLFQGLNSSLRTGDTVRMTAATSYLNYVVTNGIVLLPKYWRKGRSVSQREKDEEVRQLFVSLFRNREIVQVDALDLNIEGGGMHCITQQQPMGLR